MRSVFRLGKRGHKKNMYCTIKGCNYTSRIMIQEHMDNRISKHSDMCPKHRTDLVIESVKKAIENDNVAYCNFNGCDYTQKHDDDLNICPKHKQPLLNKDCIV